MKHFTYFTLICFLLLQTTLKSQTVETNLNSLILPSETLIADISEQVQVKNVKGVNTKGIEYSPIYHKRGIVFSSNRTPKNGWLRKVLSNNNSNLFFTEIDDNGDLQEYMELPGKLNSNRHEGSATFNATEDYMIYTRNHKKPTASGIYEVKLSSAQFINGKWVEQGDLPFNDGFRTCHPALSEDSHLLIFSANRPNGLGGMDLYASEYMNGEWTTPYNLGAEVNSSGDEVFPFLDAQGNLYYSSNGRPGMGGLDLFKTTLNEDCVWSNVLHLPKPFNTRWDDFSFTANENLDQGFFTSNRPGGAGSDDIYSWKVTAPLEIPIETESDLLTTQFKIVDEQTGLAYYETDVTVIQINPALLLTGFLEEPVTIVNRLDENVVSLLGKKIDPAFGTYSNESYLINPAESYLVIAERPGNGVLQQIVSANHLMADDSYVMVWPKERTDDIASNNDSEQTNSAQSDNLNNDYSREVVVGAIGLTDKSIENNIQMNQTEETILAIADTEIFTSRSIPENLLKSAPEPLESIDLPENRKVIAFSPIYYDFNDVGIKAKEKVLIDNIVWEMKRNKNFHLTIKSFTDSRGSETYNRKLSQQRAERVKESLIKSGISPLRLNAVGMGEDELLKPCGNNHKCNESDHRLNRRTEFIITRLN
ncbi:MAG: OmpA family protein [Saprospiraceae bacterium]